jgi:hypothetical protein
MDGDEEKIEAQLHLPRDNCQEKIEAEEGESNSAQQSCNSPVHDMSTTIQEHLPCSVSAKIWQETK